MQILKYLKSTKIYLKEVDNCYYLERVDSTMISNCLEGNISEFYAWIISCYISIKATFWFDQNSSSLTKSI